MKRLTWHCLRICVLAALIPSGGVLAADLPAASDLRAESAQAAGQGQPLVILYSRRDCGYCETVRKNHLRHLSQDPRYRGIVVRQINQDSRAPLRDFHGQASNHAAMAGREKIKLVPVVAFYGPDGQALSPPIVGARIADYYQTYLEDALEQSAQVLKQKR